MADVEIKGMRELYNALSTQIPQKMEGRVLQKALAAGAAVLVRQARNNIRGQLPDSFVGPTNKRAPASRTGTLKRAIYSGRGKTSDATKEVRIINVRRGNRAAKRGVDAYYARWVEYGHRFRKSKAGKREPGGVDPKPYMRPAWDAKQTEAVQRTVEKLRDILAVAVRSSRF